MPDAPKSIWIDLDNSPHVPLFAPIVRHYRKIGIDVVLTAREHSQTLELLELYGFGGTYKVVGRHYGGNKIAKIFGSLRRAWSLASHISGLRHRPAVAVSHGSRAMVLASRRLGVPAVTMFDYEFTETRIFNRFSDRIIVPDRIPDDVLSSIGTPLDKVEKYPGIKEELYLRTFKVDAGFRGTFMASHGLEAFSSDGVLVVVRPPATTANYHSDQSERLFKEVLDRLLSDSGVATAIVPRTGEQAQEIERMLAVKGPFAGAHVVLREAVDGLQLAAAADLLISGGGTMNREAALLGVPVYSIFAGRLGSLDAQMEKEGTIRFIRSHNDIDSIVLQRRPSLQPKQLTDRIERFVIDQIDRYLT